MASIAKRADGRWRARYRDQSGKEHSKHFNRKVDAQCWLDEVTARLVTGTYVDPKAGRDTLRDFAEQWMAGRVHLKPKTVASYDSLLASRVLPRWRDVPLSRIDYEGVGAWVAEMRADGLSASRTRQSYHLLTSMLDDAVKGGRLARNPAAGIDLPRLPRVDKQYLNHAEVEALAEASGADRLIVLTLAYTGLRWGELAALRARRVDLLRGRLEITEAVTEINGRLEWGTPKSHQTRSVPISRFLREDLAQHLAGRGPDDLAFPSARGTPLRVGNYRRRSFNTAASSVGLDGLTPHELRHTAASLAIASGASVKGVQSMLGHASATLTLDRYGHLFGDELDAIADRLDTHRTRSLADLVRTEGIVTDLDGHRASR
jgi:integrase